MLLLLGFIPVFLSVVIFLGREQTGGGFAGFILAIFIHFGLGGV